MIIFLYKTLDIIIKILNRILNHCNKINNPEYLNRDDYEIYKDLELNYDGEKTVNYFINSNFNCNFYIDRQRFF